MGEGKFLYAIIENPGEGGFCFTGFDDAHLERVPYRDIAAVVSPIDLGRFNGTDDAPLKADLVRYQQVNIALLQHYTVVPMRFGFTARDEAHIQEVLGKVYLQVRTLLNRLRGRVELVVHACWDLPKILRGIREQEGCLPTVKREGNQESAQADLGKALEVGRMLFEAAEARRQGFVEAIHARLSPLAGAFADGPRQGEAMILNRSYLVEKAKEPLFDDAMNGLGEAFDGALTFRYIGPLPASSFANVVFSQGNFALVDRARRALRLPEQSSLDRIKAAYRRLIRTYHPDRNPGDPRAEERCKEVVEAYEILDAFCQSYQHSCAGRKIAEYAFVREEVERVFIVKDLTFHYSESA